MTVHAPTEIAGLGIPDHRATIHAAFSAYTEGSPQPGVPAPVQATAATLVATGTQDAGSSLTIRTMRPGVAGVGRASFVWRNPGEDDEDFGWNPPYQQSSWEGVVRSTSTDGARNPHAITTGTGAILCAIDAPTGTTTNTVVVYRRTAGGAWASLGTVYTEDMQPTGGTARYCWPTLLELPPTVPGSYGRILLFGWTYDVVSDSAGVVMHFSDDQGVTWARGSHQVLPALVDVSGGENPQRLRVARLGDQLSLWAHVALPATGDALTQYASDDLGARFFLVNEVASSAAVCAGWPDLVAANGLLHVIFLVNDGALVRCAYWSTADAWTPFDLSSTVANDEYVPSGVIGAVSQGTVDGASGAIAIGCAAIAAMEDGSIFVYTTAGASNYPVRCYGSEDNGATWTTKDAVVRGGANDRPKRFTVTPQRGRVAMLHNNTATSAYDESLECSWFGGYHTVTLPGGNAFGRVLDRMVWSETWTPTGLPASVSATWTQTTSGASTVVLGASGILFTAAGGETCVETHTDAAGATNGRVLLAQVTHTSGVAEVSSREEGAGGLSYDIAVRITATGIEAYDVNGAASIASAAVDTTAGVLLLIARRAASARVWYTTNLHGENKVWTQVANTAALTSAAVTTDRMRWGNQPGLACVSRFEMFAYSVDTDCGVVADLLSFQTPTKLMPRPYSVSPVYVDDGVSIKLIGGPTVEGDEWTIAARSPFPIQALDPMLFPSPRQPWRSNTASIDHAIAWDLSDGVAEDSDIGNDVWFLWLDRINFPDFKLEYRRGAAWTSLGTFDAHLSLSAVRQGNTVIPATGGAAADTPYIAENELAGGYVNFGSGDVRKIVRNSAGNWATTTTLSEHRPVIYVEDIDGTEATSGTFDVWWPRALLVIHASGVRDWQAIRLTLRTTAGGHPAAPEGYHTAGSCCFGPVAVFGQPYGRGRGVTRTQDVEDTVFADGTLAFRRRSPSGRSVELTWPDARTARLHRGSGTPDAVDASDASGAEPVAGWGDTALVLDGLAHHLDDGRPVVYIPYVPRGDTGLTAHLLLTGWARGAFLGTWRNGWRYGHVAGQEEVSDVLRGGTVTVRELV